eukprot:555912-Hanusia_phi.AAC.1
MGVSSDSFLVGFGSNLPHRSRATRSRSAYAVFEHLLVDAEVRVGVKVGGLCLQPLVTREPLPGRLPAPRASAHPSLPPALRRLAGLGGRLPRACDSESTDEMARDRLSSHLPASSSQPIRVPGP